MTDHDPLEAIKNQPGRSPTDQANFDASITTSGGYMLGADSLPREGVPRGQLSQYHHRSENIYPGVERDYWIYVPAQYDASKPACLMVFQDAEFYIKLVVNAPIVFDNLIHKKHMPVTIGLFVSPGDKGPGAPIRGGTDNRSFEYDSLGDQYVRFLLEELIPEVEKNYAIVQDAAGRAICGMSSGGICAFTAAWERPDAFSKVVSHCGSFANIRGGHNYPTMIRRADKKPIRVFLQGGSNDLNVVYGDWSIANQDMASALKYREYDYQFVYGEGGHTLHHGGSIFPDTMRWLWRDYPKDVIPEERAGWEMIWRSGSIPQRYQSLAEPNPAVVEWADTLPAGGHILDVGCGVGRHCVYLGERGFRMAGVDISPNGIEQTAAVCAERGIAFEGRLSDMTTLPWPDATFDAALSTSTIHHHLRADMARAIGEVWRVLKPGGVFLADFPRVDTPSYQQQRELVAAGKILEVEPNTFVDERGAEDPDGFLPHHFSDEADLRDLLSAFTIIRLEAADPKVAPGRGPKWVAWLRKGL